MDSQNDTNQVICVDTNDNVIGYMEKLQAHKEGVLHRAVSVLIFNKDGEWLLQKRAQHKYHSGGLWTNTCCTHPYPNEKNIEAATRRLKEEMGMQYASLKKQSCFIYKTSLDNNLIEHELDHIFIGHTDILPKINTDEACDYKYVNTEYLKKDINENPNNYSVWFKLIFENYTIKKQ